MKALAGALPEAPVPDRQKKPAKRRRQRAALEAEKRRRAAGAGAGRGFDRLNQAHVKAQVAGPRQRFLDYASKMGYEVQYASELAPLVFLTGLTRSEVEELGFAEGVDAVYDASMPGGPALEIARSTQNADLVEKPGGAHGRLQRQRGERGGRRGGADVERQPVPAVTGTRDTSRAFKDHPTAVGGMVASNHRPCAGWRPERRSTARTGTTMVRSLRWKPRWTTAPATRM